MRLTAVALLLAATSLAGCAISGFVGGPSADVRVVTWADAFGYGGWRYVIGEVENMGPDAADHPRVITLDGNGSEIGYGTAPGFLRPGERAPFMIGGIHPTDTIASLSVDSRASRGTPFRNDALLLRNITVTPETYQTSIRAEYYNAGTLPGNADIYIVLRNASGNVVGLSYAVHDVRNNSYPPIRPGESVALVGFYEAMIGEYVSVEGLIDPKPFRESGSWSTGISALPPTYPTNLSVANASS